jgi:hypothetical protein
MATIIRCYRVKADPPFTVPPNLLQFLHSVYHILKHLELYSINTLKESPHSTLSKFFSELFKLADSKLMSGEERIAVAKVIRVTCKSGENKKNLKIPTNNLISVMDLCRKIVASSDYFTGLIFLWTQNTLAISREILTILSSDTQLFAQSVRQRDYERICTTLQLRDESGHYDNIYQVHKKTLGFLTLVQVGDTQALPETITHNWGIVMEKIMNECEGKTHLLKLEELYVNFLSHLFISRKWPVSSPKQMATVQDVLRNTVKFLIISHQRFEAQREKDENITMLSTLTMQVLKNHLDLLISSLSSISREFAVDQLNRDCLLILLQLFLEITLPPFLEASSSIYHRLLKLLLYFKTSKALSVYYEELDLELPTHIIDRLSRIIERSLLETLNTDDRNCSLKAIKYLGILLTDRRWRSTFLNEEKLSRIVQPGLCLFLVRGECDKVDSQFLLEYLEIVKLLSEDSNLRRRMRDDHDLSTIVGVLVIFSISYSLSCAPIGSKSSSVKRPKTESRKKALPKGFVDHLLMKTYDIVNHFKFDETFLHQLCHFEVPKYLVEFNFDFTPLDIKWINLSRSDAVSVIPYLTLFCYSFCTSLSNTPHAPMDFDEQSDIQVPSVYSCIVSMLYITTSAQSNPAARIQVMQIDQSILCFTQLYVQNELLQQSRQQTVSSTYHNPLEHLIDKILGDVDLLSFFLFRNGFCQFSWMIGLLERMSLLRQRDVECGRKRPQYVSYRNKFSYNKLSDSVLRLFKFLEQDMSDSSYYMFEKAALGVLFVTTKEKWKENLFRIPFVNYLTNGHCSRIRADKGIFNLIFDMIFDVARPMFNSSAEDGETSKSRAMGVDQHRTLDYTVLNDIADMGRLSPEHLKQPIPRRLCGAVAVQWMAISVMEDWFTESSFIYYQCLEQYFSSRVQDPIEELKQYASTWNVGSPSFSRAVTIVCSDSFTSEDTMVELEVEERIVKSVSHVFLAMLSGHFKESFDKKIYLQDVEYETFQDIIDWMRVLSDCLSAKKDFKENNYEFFTQHVLSLDTLSPFSWISRLLKTDPYRVLSMVEFADRFLMTQSKLMIELMILFLFVNEPSKKAVASESPRVTVRKRKIITDEHRTEQVGNENFAIHQIALIIYSFFIHPQSEIEPTSIPATLQQVPLWPDYLITIERDSNDISQPVVPVLITECIRIMSLCAPEVFGTTPEVELNKVQQAVFWTTLVKQLGLFTGT